PEPRHVKSTAVDLDLAPQPRRRLDHSLRRLEHDGSLVAVSRRAVDLAARLALQQERQGDAGGEGAFPRLAGHLDVGRPVLALAVRPQGAEQVPDNPLLPWEQVKGPPCPAALGVAKLRLEKLDDRLGALLTSSSRAV